MDKTRHTHFQVKTSKTDKPIPVIDNIHLHSIYNPEKEANGFVEKNDVLIKQKNKILVLGLGFGYHINELVRRLESYHGVNNFEIYVIEPLQIIADKALAYKTYNASKNITVLSGLRSKDIYNNESFIDFLIEKPGLMPHPASFNLHKDYFKNFLGHKSSTTVKEVAKHVQSQNLRSSLFTTTFEGNIEEYLQVIAKKQKTFSHQDFLLLAYNELIKSGELR